MTIERLTQVTPTDLLLRASVVEFFATLAFSRFEWKRSAELYAEAKALRAVAVRARAA